MLFSAFFVPLQFKKIVLMEMKRFCLAILMVMLSSVTYAQYVTNGDGTTYTLRSLSEIEESGVEYIYSPYTMCSHIYHLQKKITIDHRDKFVMEDDVRVEFFENVVLVIEGESDFKLTRGSTFIPYDDEKASGTSIRLNSESDVTFENCYFMTVGLEKMGDGALNVRNCHFTDHHGSSAAALYFMDSGAPSLIEGCYFANCQKAAIGSSANASQPMTIRSCTFSYNSAANNNVPQINITAANKLLIEENTVYGNPDNNMVGGIGISNFFQFESDVEIRRCLIQDNRYGIGLVGPADNFYVSDCQLLNNKYESNAMNGGSGISLYDPYQKTNAWLAGNQIEGNLWGVTIIGCKDVCLGNVDGITEQERGGNTFKNNGNGGVLYDLYNNSTLTVYAQNNTWGVSSQTEEQIESVIFHQHDNASLGEVIFWPAANTAGIHNTEHKAENNEPYYNIYGVRRSTPVKGINIIHGKKVVR